MDYYVDRAVLRDWAKLFPVLLASGQWSWRQYSDEDRGSHMLQKVYVYEPLQLHFASPAEVALFVRESNKQQLEDCNSSGSTSDCESDDSDTETARSSSVIDIGRPSASAQRARAIESTLAANRRAGAKLLSGLSFILSNLGEEEEEVSKLVSSYGGQLLPRLDLQQAEQGVLVVSSAVGHRRLAYIQALAAGVPIVHVLWIHRCLHRNVKQGSGSRGSSGTKGSSSSGHASIEPLPLEGYLLSRTHAWQPHDVHVHPLPTTTPPSSSSLGGVLSGLGVINATGKQLWTDVLRMHGAYVCATDKCADTDTHTLLTAVTAAAAAMGRHGRKADLILTDSEDVLEVAGGPLRVVNECLFFVAGASTRSPEGAEALSSDDDSVMSRSDFSGAEGECDVDAYGRLVRVVTEEWLLASVQRGAAADPDSSDQFRPPTSLQRLLTFRSKAKDRVALHDVLYYGEGKEIGLVAALSRRHKYALEVQARLLPLRRCGEGGRELRLGAGPPRLVDSASLGARVLLLEESAYVAGAFAQGDRDVFMLSPEGAEDLKAALEGCS